MIKLQKDSEILEVEVINVFPEYTTISWGDNVRYVTNEQWATYTILNEKSADELNEIPS